MAFSTIFSSRYQDIPIRKGDKKVIFGWVMYDWSNSVYQLTITTVVFPIYYIAVTTTGTDATIDFFGLIFKNTALYSFAVATSYLIVALLSPILSSIADFTGRRKTFMKVFTWIGAISCGSLFFFDRNHIEFGVIAFTLGSLGYAGSIVFYNSFLPVIAEPQDQDRISARGYSMGYLGGVILLLFNLLLILKPQWFGFTSESNAPARISFLTVCLWWLGFSQITFHYLPRYTYRKRKGRANVILNGYAELRIVFTQIRKSARLTIFLLGFFFMTMGLLTIMFMATSFGKKQLGLQDEILIPTLLGIQLVGMFGAWLFARLSDRFGNLRALIASVIIWVAVCVWAYYIKDAFGFIIAAFFIGIVMGGTQSLARSTYSKMLPETTDHTSFFSFYDVLEKVATVGGLACFGIIETASNMRNSVLGITLFFILSLLFFLLLLRRRSYSQI